MSLRIAVLIATATLFGTGAYAQDVAAGPGKVEVSLIPGGAVLFTSTSTTSSFKNYQVAGSLAYNLNRIVGVEGEVGGGFGLTENLNIGGVLTSTKTPDIFTYTGNVVANVPTRSSVVPYGTGGIGGLTLFSAPIVGLDTNETHFTGNLGGGVKWYAANGRWGVRGDYRYIMVRSSSTASDFFGPDRRNVNRIYGAVVINAVK